MNPRVKRILVYALVGGAVCVLLVSVVALPALSAAGFGILGPLAGSSAAAWQAAIGSVAAGSAFATLQSVAMTAAIPALWYIVPGAVGVGIGALIGWLTGGRNRPAAGATAAAPGGDGGDSWMMDAIRAVRRRVHHLRWASYRLSLWLSPRGGYTRCRGDDGGERGQDGERGRGRGQGFVGWVHGVARRAWDFFSWLRPRW